MLETRNVFVIAAMEISFADLGYNALVLPPFHVSVSFDASPAVLCSHHHQGAVCVRFTVESGHGSRSVATA